ncbi:MerR family transcriptional regulator [Modestobacter versicolor]|uniref:DNA-binding transcriptional MerR regulator n=1 Tax=Modestobacter versicolor TaxID=429133 RepID=A0A323V6F4_9ACTN|nr:MerR family transcriptional regulator [Modestobacter versicolor]MBB3677071.1 DNA-binding transcriptional MerR regulator [Modestobacter versicolor]PZA20409.1 MerR family transcriptional regulator [Modestobacter versicolor]
MDQVAAPNRQPAPGIRQVSEETGLSIDTLRWYEREGLLPLVERTADGRRRYPPAALRFIRLVQALRRTGMPVADVRQFIELGGGELANHPERMALLEQQCAAIEQRVLELQDDLAVVQAKIATYRALIARGADCEDDLPDDLLDQLRTDELLARTLPAVPAPSPGGEGVLAQR